MNREQRRQAEKQTKRGKTAGTRLPDETPVVFRFSGKNEFDLQHIPHQTLERFRDGTATEPNWHVLAARLNLGRVLADTHFVDASPAMVAAQDALVAVHARAERLGTWGCSQPEFQAMGEGLNLTDAMQVQCTRRELSAAFVKIYEGSR